MNDTLMAAVAAERAADFRRDAAKQRRARQSPAQRAPAGITRRAPLQRRPHAAPATGTHSGRVLASHTTTRPM
jgi:hypothetical protein